MQVTTQHEFFQANAVEGVLPDHLMGELLALPEGDTPFVPGTDGSSATPGAGEDGKTAPPAGNAPAATPTPSPAPNPDPSPAATPAPTPAPVILAKDGVHTIPYEKLEEARRAEQEARRQAEALAAENARLKAASPAAAAPAPTAAPAPAADPANVDFGDYSDESMRKAVVSVAQAAVDRATAPLLAELHQLKGKMGEADKQAEVDATKAHFTAIYTAHPDTDSILESAEFKAWKAGQPAFVRPAIEATLNEGTAQDVVELFDAYKQAAGRTTPAAAPAGAPADAAALAAARIAAVKAPVPSSLSEIPASTSVHHDEAAAMMEMNPMAVMGKFEGKSPEQIQALLSKVL